MIIYRGVYGIQKKKKGKSRLYEKAMKGLSGKQRKTKKKKLFRKVGKSFVLFNNNSVQSLF